MRCRACGASQRARSTARMLAHPSGSASPNLPYESFAFFGAFPRIHLPPRRAIHPPLRRAWLGRDASLRQSHPSRRRLALRGVGFALAPWQARLAPCALSARVRFCGARSAHLTLSKVSVSSHNCAENALDVQTLPLREGECPGGARGYDSVARHTPPASGHPLYLRGGVCVPILSPCIPIIRSQTL